MICLKDQAKEVETLVCFQLKQHWPDVNEEVIHDSIATALLEIEKGFTGLPNKRYYRDKDVCFSPYMSVQWMIFCIVCRTRYIKMGEYYSQRSRPSLLPE